MDEAKPEDAILEAAERTARMPMPHLAGAARKIVWDEVNTGFSTEQAVAEAKRCLNCAICSECMECVRACGPGALLHGERDAEMDLDVGAVVMATGFDLSVPGPNNEYGYERYANVLSALEYERMLSASGPTIGSVQRRDNGKHPKKIAFIQCVGSRDQEHEYCSSVCCSFANKQAMLTIDHEPDCEPTVFLMDMRAQGKGFDAFYQRAIDKGVKFVRSRPSYIKEDPLTGDLLISWEDEGGKMHETRYDMVVLSAGLEPARKAQEAAGHVGVALNRHGFCQLHEFNPLETSRKGVFVVGPFGEPKDIPDSVAQASAAAAQVMTGLADSRGTLTVDKEYPDEKTVVGEEPRVGVFVCHCGSNIAGVIGVESVAEYASQLPGVAFATDTMYTCSSDSLTLIRDAIEEHNLNRVVVASCTPRTHEPIFQDTLREAGLNPFLFEMANIRDQASWVHAKEPEKATQKAKELVQMSVARARLLEPLYKVDVPLTHAAVVIGGGVAGMTAASALGDMGHEVHLIERAGKLGGHVLDLGVDHQGQRPGGAGQGARAAPRRQPQRQDPPRGRAGRLPRLHRQLLERHRREGRQAHAGRQRRRRRRHRRRREPAGRALRPRLQPEGRHRHGPRAHAQGGRPGAQRRQVRRLHPLRRLARREPPLLLAHLLPAERQERHRAQGAGPLAPGLRVVQGDAHLRPPRGVLHEGA